jgi:transcriptional regulator with XRE-family HTH domain
MERLEARRAGEPPLPRPGARLAIRLAVGATQGDIAEECGVDRATVARWESGRREPRGELRRRYAAVLDELHGALS